MKPESLFRKRVVDFLRTLPRCKIFSIQQKTIVGHPDLILCLDGLFVGIEIKTDIGRPSARQILTLEEVLKANGVALITRPSNFEEIKELLQKITKGIRYDKNDLQRSFAPPSNERVGQNRKHSNVTSKKLRSEQTSIGGENGDSKDEGREHRAVEDFREI